MMRIQVIDSIDTGGRPVKIFHGNRDAVMDAFHELFPLGWMIVPGSAIREFKYGQILTISLYRPDDYRERITERKVRRR